ncbi:glycosyltransferase family 2 protein [Bdellovibrio sp. SKB1291214]|uniref:glycosyltransferase family 2 protein n=1 Tax=Bdellovibrio sp. SKB1291214 TaxID=1732569 RepID=UPI000B51D63F|nr:glycosyltransferase family 2 protein [Bdellovibrio sp. SKB1291214]UYL08305.1 glycosyltransferase family 2 protein [Bdellovibrio sp. SKB1291214]
MLNIVIPMAGLGSRFQKEGYALPKPLIDVAGKPMIKVVVENLRPTTPHKFIFIVQEKHITEFHVDQVLKTVAPNCEIVAINGLTEGAACTVLCAEKYIDNGDALMIANCDQFVEVNMDEYLKQASGKDGFIMTMTAHDNKWSFVRLNDQNEVKEVREKEVISSEATVGIYNFKHGKDFCTAARKMIAANERVNNEFYVAPTYNLMIKDGAKVGIYNIGTLGKGMHGIGVPDDLKEFLQRGLV